jgi:hypothetical protein
MVFLMINPLDGAADWSGARIVADQFSWFYDSEPAGRFSGHRP